jgi:hypothetical protein
MRVSELRMSASGEGDESARSMIWSISTAIARIPAECISRLSDSGLPHASGNVSRTAPIEDDSSIHRVRIGPGDIAGSGPSILAQRSHMRF